MPRSTIIMLPAGEPVTNMVSPAAKSRIRTRVKVLLFPTLEVATQHTFAEQLESLIH
jgi:hypothetical protein